jgi:hypothetical protein
MVCSTFLTKEIAQSTLKAISRRVLFGLPLLALSAMPMPALSFGLTTTSPTQSGALPNNISAVGGIVLDLIGANDARVISQLSAASLFQGWPSWRNPNTTIGTQTGFTASVISALGGGLKEVGIRFTLYDGDTAKSNFDWNDNFLLVNGINFGNWSSVNAVNTDSQGNAGSYGTSGGGFRNNILDTGWFYSNNATQLGSFYNTLSSGQVLYQLYDKDPGDQYLDFKQGIAASQLNVSQAPVVAPPEQTVPEPTTILGSVMALGAFSAARRRLHQQKNNG